MRKTFYNLFALLAMITGMNSCSSENDFISEPPTIAEPSAKPAYEFDFNFTTTNDTRAVKSEWTDGDIICVYFDGNNNGFLKISYNGAIWNTCEIIGVLDNIDNGSTALAIWTDKNGFAPSTASAIIEYPSAETLTCTSKVTVSGSKVSGSFILKQHELFTKVTISGLYEGSWKLKITGESFAYVPKKNNVSIEASAGVAGLPYYMGIASEDGYYFFVKSSNLETTTFTLESETAEFTKTFAKSLNDQGGKAIKFAGPQNDDMKGWSGRPKELEYVDLGLSSGTLWATCNLGAGVPEMYGEYYFWGATTPLTLGVENECLTNCSSNELYANGYITANSSTAILTEKYDAATATWGTLWSMPTQKQFTELINECTWTWCNGQETKYKDTTIRGYLITSNKNGNSNSIFLPAAGYIYGNGKWLDHKNTRCWYWTSSNNSGLNSSNAILYQDSYKNDNKGIYPSQRLYGYSVRPVRKYKW